MTIEERLHDSLESRLARLDTPPGDLAAVRARGSRVRRTRRLAAAGLAVAVVAAGGLAAGVVRDLRSDRATDPAISHGGRWSDLPPMPLSPRLSPVAVWTGQEALVIGGTTSTPCPPNADCLHPDTMSPQGAAYVPSTNTWHRIADAPVPVGYYFRSTVVGDSVVLYGDDTWLIYDVGHDQWRTVAGPARNIDDTGTISGYAGRAYAMSQAGRVEVLDIAAGTWSELPSRQNDFPGPVIATPVGIFVSGIPPEDGVVQYFEVDTWDGQAWHTTNAFSRKGPVVAWTGARLIGLPYANVAFDPATSRWSDLPTRFDPDHLAPPADREDWQPSAVDGPLVAEIGYAYDDDSGEIRLVGRPDGTPVDKDQGATWADGRLLLFGGLDEATGYTSVTGLSDQAWEWTP